MMSATSSDDARARATIVLESLEKSISASAEATQNFQKENMMLKEQIELILRDNIILKRLVAIQHERQKEHNDDRIQEVQQLKHLIAQCQEQLRTLEVQAAASYIIFIASMHYKWRCVFNYNNNKRSELFLFTDISAINASLIQKSLHLRTNF
ncbi:uncharacterized protein LOC107022440 [Solanum pennellii]|uniref:Uncharacterized protein LOC107022440 n=1 Tax=Solanum pennellii TaxID=28526 RepID=A0ABM1H076_SOLPN|nr:uncharacterized protein LOC107022440 [Solanum pennellii]